MKVLFLTTDSKIGGAEKVILTLAAGMRQRKVQIWIICLKPGGTLLEEAEKSGITAECCRVSGISAPRGFIRLVKRIREISPDIIHAHLFHANLLGTFAGLIARVPVILVTEHGFDTIGGKIRNIWRNVYGCLADGLVAISTNVGSYFSKFWFISPSRVCVIHNGIHPVSPKRTRVDVLKELELNPSSKDLIIVSLSHFRREKGVEILVTAMKEVVQNHRGTRLILVGSGQMEENLKKMVSDMELENEVIFTGFRSDAGDILSAADIFALPSFEEGLPITLLEAASLGKPVVASRVGSIPEVIVSNKSGILVEPNNPQQLAAAILKLADNPGLGEAYGKELFRSWEKRFSASTMIDKTYNYYLRNLERKNR